MPTISQLFDDYKIRAQKIIDAMDGEVNAALIALENQVADASSLHEGDRLELRARMQEYRSQKINEFEAGAQNPKISKEDNGPRSGEYETNANQSHE